jgi:hypothetical protein
MTQTEKNCTNCYWHNNGCPSTGEVCNGLSMWKPKACDYWNGEECTFDHGACDSQVETDYSHKIQGLIFSRYAELFTNYTFIDHETAIDLMAGEIQVLRKELQQYKEALKSACGLIVETGTTIQSMFNKQFNPSVEELMFFFLFRAQSKEVENK